MKKALRYLLAVIMVTAGILHLMRPEKFVQIVPNYLPAPRALVFISGCCEIFGGAGLLIPRVRKPAAWGLVALFIAVFPANVNMAVNKILLDSPLILWGRLPFQAVLIAWAWWYTRRDGKTP